MPTPNEIEAARRFFGPPASIVMPPTCLAMGRVLLAALHTSEETSLARGRLLDEHRAGCEWKTRAEAAEKERDELHGRLTAAVDRIIEIKEWHGKALEERDEARAALALRVGGCCTDECEHVRKGAPRG